MMSSGIETGMFSVVSIWFFSSLKKFQTFSDLNRYQINKTREEEIRAYNLKMKPVWDAEKAVENAKANREQLLYLAKETGTKVSFSMFSDSTFFASTFLLLFTI